MIVTLRHALLASLPTLLAGLAAVLTAGLLVVAVLAAPVACAPKPLSPADQQAIVVAEDACEEIAAESDEAWVKLLCKIGGDVAGYVMLPRPEWEAVKAQKVRTTDWKTSRAARKAAGEAGAP